MSDEQSNTSSYRSLQQPEAPPEPHSYTHAVQDLTGLSCPGIEQAAQAMLQCLHTPQEVTALLFLKSVQALSRQLQRTLTRASTDSVDSVWDAAQGIISGAQIDLAAKVAQLKSVYAAQVPPSWTTGAPRKVHLNKDLSYSLQSDQRNEINVAVTFDGKPVTLAPGETLPITGVTVVEVSSSTPCMVIWSRVNNDRHGTLASVLPLPRRRAEPEPEQLEPSVAPVASTRKRRWWQRK